MPLRREYLLTIVIAVSLITSCWCQLWAQSGTSTPIEIPRDDLLSKKGWTANQVQIVGIRLGMSRQRASIAARENGYRLMQEGSGARFGWFPCADNRSCFVAAAAKDLFEAISVEFSPGGTVVTMDIHLDVESKADLLDRFRGTTGHFFQTPYSDDTRRRLFGDDAISEEFEGRYGDKYKDTRFIYRRRGIVVTVSPKAGITIPQRDTSSSELISLSFIPPRL